MATPTSPPVQMQTCVLRAGIKCCNGCQTKAKRKLQSVSGVSSVEYNAEQGLLIVSGDVNPETLLRKLTEWGKKPELVSLLGSVPLTCPEHNQTKKTMEKKNKCFLLRCFGKPGTQTKVEPYRGPWPENATAPLLYPHHPPPPPPQAIPYPPPSFGASQPPPYPHAAMFRPPPPHSPPFIQFPHMVNSRLHYPYLH